MNNLDYISTAVDEFSRFFWSLLYSCWSSGVKLIKYKDIFFCLVCGFCQQILIFFFVVFGSIYTREIFKIILQSTVRVEFL